MSQSVFYAWWRDKSKPTSNTKAAGTITVTTSLTEILRIDTRNLMRVMIAIKNGATAFNAFQVLTEVNPDQTAPVLNMSAAGDFTATDNIFLGVTINDNVGAATAFTDMTTLPGGYLGMIGFEVRGIATLILQASCASGSSNVASYWGAN